MSAVSLELAKAHMKIDGNAEDELVSLYIDGAEAWIGNYIGKPIAELETVPADIKIAILKLVSFHYETRNLVIFGGSIEIVPGGVTSLLDSYRLNWFGEANGE